MEQDKIFKELIEIEKEITKIGLESMGKITKLQLKKQELMSKYEKELIQ